MMLYICTSSTSLSRRCVHPYLQSAIQLEYVWQGGMSKLDMRSKTRTWTHPVPPKDVSELPIWNFDGSSTGQAPGHDSEVLIKPVRMFPDPFRGAPHLLVLCECVAPDMTPLPTNTRHHAKAIFDAGLEHEPWFGECLQAALQLHCLASRGKICSWPASLACHLFAGFPY